jgi:hypothetical protein
MAANDVVSGKTPVSGQPVPSGKRLLHEYFSSIGATEHSSDQIALVLGAISHISEHGLYGKDPMTSAVVERFKIVPAVWQAGSNHALNTSVGEGILFASLMKEWATRKKKDFTKSALINHNEENDNDSTSAIQKIGDYASANLSDSYKFYHEGRVLSVIALHYVVCRAAAYGATLRIRQSAEAINDTLLSGNLGLRAWFQTIVENQRGTEFGRTSVMYFRIRVFVNSGLMSPREVIEAYDTLFGPDYVYFLGIRKTVRDASSPF